MDLELTDAGDDERVAEDEFACAGVMRENLASLRSSVEKIFSVSFGIGADDLSHRSDGQIWLKLRGPRNSVAAAKLYVKGLVNEEQQQEVSYPGVLHCIFCGARGLFMDCLIKSTSAHIVVGPQGCLLISGLTESVVQAYSLITDLLERGQCTEPINGFLDSHRAFNALVEALEDGNSLELVMLPGAVKESLLTLVRESGFDSSPRSEGHRASRGTHRVPTGVAVLHRELGGSWDALALNASACLSPFIGAGDPGGHLRFEDRRGQFPQGEQLFSPKPLSASSMETERITGLLREDILPWDTFIRPDPIPVCAGGAADNAESQRANATQEVDEAHPEEVAGLEVMKERREEETGVGDMEVVDEEEGKGEAFLSVGSKKEFGLLLKFFTAMGYTEEVVRRVLARTGPREASRVLDLVQQEQDLSDMDTRGARKSSVRGEPEITGKDQSTGRPNGRATGMRIKGGRVEEQGTRGAVMVGGAAPDMVVQSRWGPEWGDTVGLRPGPREDGDGERQEDFVLGVLKKAAASCGYLEARVEEVYSNLPDLSTHQLILQLQRESARETGALRDPSDREAESLRDPSARETGALRDPSDREAESLRDPSAREPGGLRDHSAREPGGLRDPSDREAEALRDPSAREPGGLRDHSAREPGGLRDHSAREAGALRDHSAREAAGAPPERESRRTGAGEEEGAGGGLGMARLGILADQRPENTGLNEKNLTTMGNGRLAWPNQPAPVCPQSTVFSARQPSPELFPSQTNKRPLSELQMSTKTSHPEVRGPPLLTYPSSTLISPAAHLHQPAGPPARTSHPKPCAARALSHWPTDSPPLLADATTVTTQNPDHPPPISSSRQDPSLAGATGKQGKGSFLSPLATTGALVTGEQRFLEGLQTTFNLRLADENGDPGLRMIIIDGSNVAMSHGLGQFFSCRGIALAVQHFWARGHRRISAILPQWRQKRDPKAKEQHYLTELQNLGLLSYTPSREFLGKRINSYDDRFMLQAAQQTAGVIVTNDNLRDLLDESQVWRDIIKKRLLQYTFVGDLFMVPDDPLGRGGPHLDHFLRSDHRSPDPGSHTFAGIASPFLCPKSPRARTEVLQYHDQCSVLAPEPRRADQAAGTERRPGRGGAQQGGSGGASEASVPGAVHPEQGLGPQRGVEETARLRESLRQVFPDQDNMVNLVLQKHPGETDINFLSHLVLETQKG